MAVRVTTSSPVSSSFSALLIVGTVFGIILLILPLMLWRCRRSKDSNSSRSYRTNQKSTTNPGAETNDRSSATKDDVLYASVNPGATGSEEPTEITYSIIPLKKLRKKNRHCEPEDGVIYSEVKPGAAEPTPLYAEINHKNKAKKKKAQPQETKGHPLLEEGGQTSRSQQSDLIRKEPGKASTKQIRIKGQHCPLKDISSPPDVL
ncbi:PREDICTED: uncharacterized protein LOC107103118 [Cyprinodon variegatus]|uniref:uncharacterized protein LOC107103118 n=1 Tax=Cyprinodon variegatus TaxID=28743 RepID=UPI00074251BB|nr:PREDICTED: uncharacterized protein LOC107103118 [Cyprinodon variegatus]